MITISVNGAQYTDFVSARCTVSLETLANDFEFVASAVGGFPPFRYGDTVAVLVDGEAKVTGIISRISGADARGNHTVTYSGRDQTSDLIDSNIDNLGDISADGLTLKSLIEQVITHIGSPLTVTDNLNPDAFNKAEDKIQPQVGENCFDFVRKYAVKRQALLTSDGSGALVITQSDPTDSGAILQRLVNSQSNNIISQSWEINYDERFNKYFVRGQLDPLGLNFAGFTSSATLVAQGGEETDSDIPAGRQIVIVESDGYSDSQLEDRAKWTKQLAIARSLRYSCTVKNHAYKGVVWRENTLVQVNSDAADINRKMLISSATFTQAEGAATTTNLELVEKNVYTIDSALLSQKKTGNQFDGFF